MVVFNIKYFFELIQNVEVDIFPVLEYYNSSISDEKNLNSIKCTNITNSGYW